MNPTLALLLAQDGITNGTVFALLAVAILLVFLVTRVLFVAHGEFVVLGAITVVQVQRGEVPGAVWLLIPLAILCIALSTIQFVRERNVRLWLLQNGICVLALGMGLCATIYPPVGRSVWVQVTTVLCLVTPMGPLLYWIEIYSSTWVPYRFVDPSLRADPHS
jgi:branched-chain amino acid transport system permease protein